MVHNTVPPKCSRLYSITRSPDFHRRAARNVNIGFGRQPQIARATIGFQVQLCHVLVLPNCNVLAFYAVG